MIPANLTDKQDRAFAAHVLDLFELVQQKHSFRFTGFLDMHQLSVARQLAASSGYPNYLFFGGHPAGERVMLGVFAPYEEADNSAFPIVPITVSFREKDEIGHRDILGSLIGLKIKREAVGDILIGNGYAVFFVTEATAPIILSELSKIGSCGVKLSQGLPAQLPALHDYADMDLNVSSLRLDCIVAAVTGVSREKSAQTIKSKLVSVNGAINSETSYTIHEGAVVSIRGFGKFVFSQVGRVTKKGRLQILCRKYV
ncbi:YlmH/Sll1252 family protein [Oscillospiraceae bacterium PP1C4]